MENRRSFLTKTVLASATVAGLNPAALGANERINLAQIGAHNQGWYFAKRMAKHARYKTLCDIDEAVINERKPMIEEIQNAKLQTERDFRRVLDDKDIDAVIISVPDHWHTHIALLACQAGKDVYCEKPLTQTISEGHMLRAAARKYNRVFQVGTQRRSSKHFREAATYATSGKLGKICEIKTWVYQVRKSIGNPPDDNIVGQGSVEAMENRLGRQARFHEAVCGLAECVDARIGPAGGPKHHAPADYFGKGLFHLCGFSYVDDCDLVCIGDGSDINIVFSWMQKMS